MYSIERKWKTAAIGATACVIASLIALHAPAAATHSGAAAPAVRRGAAPRRPPKPRPPISLPPGLDIPQYTPGPCPFRDGETLIYDASWEGIPAAQVRIILSRPKRRPEFWTGQMWLSSSKVVDVLYRMRDYFRENFSVSTWRPDDILILQHEKQRQDEWRAEFSDNGRFVKSVKRNREGRVWTREFAGGEPWGPFSGAMMALSQPLAPGNTYTFDVFSGGNRYVFAFKVIKRERITTGLGTFDTLRIEPSVVWLSQGSFRRDASETTLWVTDDARHLPVRIESAVYIGSVVADLVQATAAPGGDLKQSAPEPVTAANAR